MVFITREQLFARMLQLGKSNENYKSKVYCSGSKRNDMR